MLCITNCKEIYEIAYTVRWFTGSVVIGKQGCALALDETGVVFRSNNALIRAVDGGSFLILLCPGERWKPAGGIYILTRRELSGTQ